MQLTTVLLAAMAIFVTAQDTSLIPQCALPCIFENNPLSGCASVTDFPCLCLTGEEYNRAIALCIINSCSSPDVSAMVAWKTQTCATYGVVWPS